MNVGESFLGRTFAGRHPQGGQDNRTSSQPVQSTAPTFSADRVCRIGEEAWRRPRCQGVYLLDAVRLHAVLPTRPRRLPARDLQRVVLLSGSLGAFRHLQGSVSFDAVLCQRTPSRRAVRGTVLDGFGPFP